MGALNDWDVTDANNNAAPPDGWPENTMAYSDVNNTGRAVQGTVKRFFDDNNGSLVGAGIADVYTVTLNESYAAYFTGMTFACSIPATNTGAATVDVNGIGAISIVNKDGSALLGGALENGGVYSFTYDGTDFQILGGGGGVDSAGGSDTELQYNNGGLLGGITEFVYDDAVVSGDLFAITNRSGQTGGDVVAISTNDAAYGGRRLFVENLDVTSFGELVRFTQLGINGALAVDTGVNCVGNAIRVDHVGASDHAVEIIDTGASAFSAIRAEKNNADGSALQAFTSDAGRVSSDVTASIGDLNAASTGTVLSLSKTGTTGITLRIDNNGSIVFDEASDHKAPALASQGQIWVRDDAPNIFVFTDDAATDFDMIGHVAGVLDLTALESQIGEFNETEGTFTGGAGTKNLDVSTETVFSASSSMAGNAITFTFDNPPASGRAATITLILDGASTATLTWPASVDWPGGGAEPTWSTGIDVVSFVTVDAGTTWYGFLGGLDFA